MKVLKISKLTPGILVRFLLCFVIGGLAPVLVASVLWPAAMPWVIPFATLVTLALFFLVFVPE